MNLGKALHRALFMAGKFSTDGCKYSAHSLRISGCNGLLNLKFPKEWILRRLDWETEEMLQVYRDSTITVTDDSRWFLRTFALILDANLRFISVFFSFQLVWKLLMFVKKLREAERLIANAVSHRSWRASANSASSLRAHTTSLHPSSCPFISPIKPWNHMSISL